MSKRKHKATSKLGEAHIAPHKESHKEKIIAGLKKLRVGGTQEQIAEACGLRADQCWKRLSELADTKQDGGAIIFDTGLMKPLKSGVPGIVWQLVDNDKRSISKASDFAQAILKQANLFQ